MGYWITRYNAPSVRGVFWSSYVLGVLFNIISFGAAGNTKYSFEPKNKAQWLGCKVGTICSILLWGIIACIVANNWILLIIIICTGVPLVIIGTIYIYKDSVMPLVLEEKKAEIKHAISVLELLRRQGEITNENFIAFLEQSRSQGMITNEEFFAYKKLTEKESRNSI